MGWFAIACLLGYIGFWHWGARAERLSRARGISQHEARLIVAIRLAIFAAVIICLWAILYEGAKSIRQIADIFGGGALARFLLGLILGIGAAYVVAERSTIRPANGGFAAFLRGEDDAENHASNGPGTGVVLSIGAGIAIIALIAPHIDGWFSHLTNLKTPLLEFQLTSTATQKVRLAEAVEAFNNQKSLKLLVNFGFRVDQDIKLLKIYEKNKPDAKNKLAIKAATELLPVFQNLVSPVAGCMQKAIDNGLSIDGARNLIRPMADLLEQITLGLLKAQDESKTAHDRFWAHVMELPGKIRPFLKEKEDACIAIPASYAAPNNSAPFFPRIENYKTVPYLYVAAALFMTFMADDDIALKILQDARRNPDLAFVDYNLLYLIGALNFYQGKPGDLDQSYFGLLNRMRRTAREHIEVIKRDGQECNSDEDLLCRARIAELGATNAIVYFLAEDLARDSVYALPYRARLEEYANELRRVLDVLAIIEADAFYLGGESGGFYAHVATNKYIYVDTYAYATLVVETAKANPDREKLKKLAALFNEVVEHVEEDVKRSQQSDTEPQELRVDLSQLKIARAHRAAARALVGE